MGDDKDWKYRQRNGEGKEIDRRKKQDDANLPKADIYKMRAYEAMFLDEFCDAFFKTP